METGSSTVPAALRLMAAGTCSCLTPTTASVQVLRVSDGAYVRSMCSEGSGPGQIKGNGSVALDGQGNVVVADGRNHRVQVLRCSDGAHLSTIGSKGSGAGQFNLPRGVAFDSAGHIIVADREIIECRCCATATAATYEPSAAKAVETGSSSLPTAF